MRYAVTVPFPLTSLVLTLAAAVLLLGAPAALAQDGENGTPATELTELKAQGCSLKMSDPKARAESYENALEAMTQLYTEKVEELYAFKDPSVRDMVVRATMERPRTTGFARGIMPDRSSVLCQYVVVDFDPEAIIAKAKSLEQ